MKRKYYSQRRGTNPYAQGIDLHTLKKMVLTVYQDFFGKEYFQEAFGFSCIDAGDVPGSLGRDIEAAVMFKLRKSNIWPFTAYEGFWEEDDVFDVVEFLYDHISKPTKGHFHSYGECGWHYEEFDGDTGKAEFRSKINELLEDYDTGYELSTEGEVLRKADPGTGPLLEAPIPTKDDAVRARIEAAIRKYRRHNSTMDDRRDAVRDLADALERLRPQLKVVLKRKDESDLFEIANTFGIRHFNAGQKTEYDPAIWLSWMFYFYLATLHASLRFIEKQTT
jgi:hypothetical protein